jgi:hypothetical protein
MDCQDLSDKFPSNSAIIEVGLRKRVMDEKKGRNIPPVHPLVIQMNLLLFSNNVNIISWI